LLISDEDSRGGAKVPLEGLPASDRQQLRVRDGVDASLLVLGFPDPQ